MIVMIEFGFINHMLNVITIALNILFTIKNKSMSNFRYLRLTIRVSKPSTVYVIRVDKAAQVNPFAVQE